MGEGCGGMCGFQGLKRELSLVKRSQEPDGGGGGDVCVWYTPDAAPCLRVSLGKGWLAPPRHGSVGGLVRKSDEMFKVKTNSWLHGHSSFPTPLPSAVELNTNII